MIRNIILSLLLSGLSIGCEQHENKQLLTSEEDNPIWTQTHNGVWKSVINEPDEINLLNTSGSTPRVEVLEKMEAGDFPLDHSAIKAYTKNGKTYLRFPLDETEQIYGLGLNFKTVQQRKRIL